MYGDLFECGLEFLDCAGDNDNVGAFFGEEDGDAFAHAFRATGDQYCLSN